MRRLIVAIGWATILTAGCETPGGSARDQIPDHRDPKYLSSAADGDAADLERSRELHRDKQAGRR